MPHKQTSVQKHNAIDLLHGLLQRAPAVPVLALALPLVVLLRRVSLVRALTALTGEVVAQLQAEQQALLPGARFPVWFGARQKNKQKRRNIEQGKSFHC